MAYLIDTSVFVTLERRGHSLAALDAATAGASFALATATAAELLFGVERADSPERRRQRATFVETVLGQVPVLPFDLPAARVHARVWAHLANTGRPIGERDLFIAATALAHGYEVLTENLREFERVPGLVVRRPPW